MQALTREAIADQLSAIWKKVLGKEVASSDDFFAMGGDSLSAIRLVMEVQKTFQTDLDVETFFEQPSIDRLATMLAKKDSLPRV